MQRSRDKAPLIFTKGPDGRWLLPAAAFDLEQIDADPVGTEYDVRRRSKRSNPQLRLYWATLADVLDRIGHDTWPTAEHLSDALKKACGYIMVNYDLSGEPYVATDSISFDAMDQATFQAYFDRAMGKLAETVGFDPLDAYEERKIAFQHTQRLLTDQT